VLGKFFCVAGQKKAALAELDAKNERVIVLRGWCNFLGKMDRSWYSPLVNSIS